VGVRGGERQEQFVSLRPLVSQYFLGTISGRPSIGIVPAVFLLFLFFLHPSSFDVWDFVFDVACLLYLSLVLALEFCFSQYVKLDFFSPRDILVSFLGQ